MNEIRSITFIGAGNVAWHLANAFYKEGIRIIQIYSRTLSKANELAEKVNADFTTELSGIKPSADIYIIALTDDVILDISGMIGFNDKLLVHTAGSVSMSVFEDKVKNYGVFYPLQSFTKDRKIDLEEVPFCIEASNEKNLEILFQLAHILTKKVYVVNSEERKKIHLAAVLANNFTNFMYILADDYLAKNELSFELLKPLITETVEKLVEFKPYDAQTGPARRGNRKIIREHLLMLEGFPQVRKIYELLSMSIQNKYLS